MDKEQMSRHMPDVSMSKVEANRMKKMYEIPELKVSLLEKTDIIVTSDNTPGGDDDELPIY